MKRLAFLARILATMLFCLSVAACGGGGESEPPKTSSETPAPSPAPPAPPEPERQAPSQRTGEIWRMVPIPDESESVMLASWPTPQPPEGEEFTKVEWRSLKSDLPKSEIVAFYQDGMKKKLWEQAAWEDSPESSTGRYVHTDRKETVYIVVGTYEGKTTVSLMWATKEPAPEPARE